MVPSSIANLVPPPRPATAPGCVSDYDVSTTMGTAYLTPEETPTRDQVDRMPGLVLVEFGTDWCGICRALQPTVAALTAQHPHIRHLKVEDGPGLPLGRQLARPSPSELKEAFQALGGGTP
jgi:thiol-disulfide isomerase/thioredoxin